jgi:hypothetical protein
MNDDLQRLGEWHARLDATLQRGTINRYSWMLFRPSIEEDAALVALSLTYPAAIAELRRRVADCDRTLETLTTCTTTAEQAEADVEEVQAARYRDDHPSDEERRLAANAQAAREQVDKAAGRLGSEIEFLWHGVRQTRDAIEGAAAAIASTAPVVETKSPQPSQTASVATKQRVTAEILLPLIRKEVGEGHLFVSLNHLCKRFGATHIDVVQRAIDKDERLKRWQREGKQKAEERARARTTQLTSTESAAAAIDAASAGDAAEEPETEDREALIIQAVTAAVATEKARGVEMTAAQVSRMRVDLGNLPTSQLQQQTIEMADGADKEVAEAKEQAARRRHRG